MTIAKRVSFRSEARNLDEALETMKTPTVCRATYITKIGYFAGFYGGGITASRYAPVDLITAVELSRTIELR
jgi:hypothetical protein